MRRLPIIALFIALIAVGIAGCGGGGGHRGSGGTISGGSGGSGSSGDSQSLSSGIYIIGSYKDPSTGLDKACYWVNGSIHPLPNDPSNPHSFALGAAIYGSDLYICGASGPTSDAFTACYWKNNGNPVLLDTPANSISYSPFVSASLLGVFIVGGYKSGTLAPTPCYWKVDGSRVNLGNSGFAYGVAANNNDVYIGGTANDRAYIWKNNAAQATLISNDMIGDQTVNGVAFDQSGVLYACGTGSGNAWY